MNRGERQATAYYIFGAICVILGLFVAVQTQSMVVLVVTMAIGVAFVVLGDKAKGTY